MSETPAIAIRPLETKDLPELISVHQDSFPDALLTRLGAEVLRRFYAWQLTGMQPKERPLAIGAFVDEKLAGYCLGGVFRLRYAGFYRQERLYLAFRVITRPWVALSPTFFQRLKRTKNFRAQLKQNQQPLTEAPSPNKKGPTFRIAVLAVHSQYRRHGLGKALMEEADRVAKEQGFEAMGLTVSASNDRAIRFYEKIGWKSIGMQKDSVLMRKHLTA